MFSSKFVASLALLAPLVSALTIETPTNWTSSDPAVITWTAVAGDTQTFSVELQNAAFNRQFALANNVPTGQLSLSLTLPVVPVGDGYVLQFVDIGNVTNVFAETGDFAIGASISSSTSSSTTSSSTSGTVSATSLTVSASAVTTSSSFGRTVSGTSSNSGSSTGTGTESSTATNTGSNFNSGAQALGFSSSAASFAVMAVAAIAGAQFVGL